MQPTREAASNPIVIILSVVCGVVLVFFLINYALYVFAQQNKPKKAGKRVRVCKLASMLLIHNIVCTFIHVAGSSSTTVHKQVSKKKQRREVLRGSGARSNGSATPSK